VVTTPTAKGVFPEDHPLSCGVVGLAGHAAAKELILGGEVDVLMCIGTSLNERATYNWDERVKPKKALIQVEVDPDRIGNAFPIDIPLVGDARTILNELYFHIRRAAEKTSVRSKWNVDSPVLTSHSAFLHQDERQSDQTP